MLEQKLRRFFAEIKRDNTMMPFTTSPRLVRLCQYFDSYGAQRLNGLDESYFRGLDENERSEAWDFLVKFGLSKDTIDGLIILDRERAIALIKDAVASPVGSSPYPAERREVETARLSMLKCLNDICPENGYINAMCKFASSEFEEVRALFAQALPAKKIAPGAVEALKAMICTEVEGVALTSTITKFMLIHGMEFDRHDALYKSLYASLNSGDSQKKMVAMNRLENFQPS